MSEPMMLIDDDTFDLRPFSDPTCETVAIGDAADGDTELLDLIKKTIREDERIGLCKILFMDDNYAVVKKFDEIIITMNEKHPLVAAMMAECAP
jgi:hypothetical protein